MSSCLLLDPPAAEAPGDTVYDPEDDGVSCHHLMAGAGLQPRSPEPVLRPHAVPGSHASDSPLFLPQMLLHRLQAS